MEQVFPIAPTTVKPWILSLPVVILVGIAILIGWLMVKTAQGMRSSTFAIGPDGLRIRGDVYGRLIPRSAILADQARAVDLGRDRDVAPTIRTRGTGLPGYSAGWFRLRNGQKALLYVTDRSRVAYIPTTEGYAVLLSTPDPDALIAALRAGG